jgi:hypothetical protein
MERVSVIEVVEPALPAERQLVAPLATDAEARVDDDVIDEPA